MSDLDELGAFYDREGAQLTTRRWAELQEDREYVRIARDEIGRAPLVVSTVWLGIDHRFMGDGPPIIYETMLFGPYNYGELGMARYTHEDIALAGHALWVDKARRQYHGLVKQARDERRRQMKWDLEMLARRHAEGTLGEMARASVALASFRRRPA